MITDIVGSFVSIQGISPRSAKAKKNLSDLGGFLKPYLREKRNIITVKTSDAAVGIAPIPAPFASCPKKITQDTIDQTNHVYGCGFILFLTTSNR